MLSETGLLYFTQNINGNPNFKVKRNTTDKNGIVKYHEHKNLSACLSVEINDILTPLYLHMSEWNRMFLNPKYYC